MAILAYNRAIQPIQGLLHQSFRLRIYISLKDFGCVDYIQRDGDDLNLKLSPSKTMNDSFKSDDYLYYMNSTLKSF
jgi:hypothetical protein